jgi:succinate-semialdehyde dehydrogenase/glutarate-semialdehyde dehydrogenase
VTHIAELLIDGAWTPSADGRTVPLRSPVTGEHLAEVAMATVDDVDAAVSTAAGAGADLMEAMPPFERADRLRRVAELLDQRADELADTLTLEQGKPRHTEAADEIAESADIFRWAAEEVVRLETPSLPGADPDKLVLTHRRPNGVYALVTPWNFPMNIPAELLAPALGGGNSFVFKPSEFTPLTAAGLTRAVLDAGFPPEAVHLLHGDAAVGEALVSHRGVDAVAFVGSAATATAVVRAAGLKRTLVEASGNGPQIICDDADLDAAAAAAVYGASFAGGQCCVATERLLVQESVHEEVLELILHHARQATLGDPRDEGTVVGPLNHEAVAATVDEHLADARAKGASIRCGGERATGFPTDLYYPLTVIDGVTTDMLLFTDETFGPVLPITTFTDDDEAVALANDSHLGLQAAVFTSSLRRAFHYVHRVRAGSIVVNDSTDFWEPHPPFGGASRTQSGWGRIGGKYTLLDMTDLRTAVIDINTTRD